MVDLTTKRNILFQIYINILNALAWIFILPRLSPIFHTIYLALVTLITTNVSAFYMLVTITSFWSYILYEIFFAKKFKIYLFYNSLKKNNVMQ